MIYFPQIRNYCRSVVLHRFDKINKGKAWSEQIKPFNFYHVGFQTLEENGKAVKPLSPFSNVPQNIVLPTTITYGLTFRLNSIDSSLENSSHNDDSVSKYISLYSWSYMLL